MKKLFEIDWPDYFGLDAITQQSLLDHITTTSRTHDVDLTENIIVVDITPEKRTAPPLGGHDF